MSRRPSRREGCGRTGDVGLVDLWVFKIILVSEIIEYSRVRKSRVPCGLESLALAVAPGLAAGIAGGTPNKSRGEPPISLACPRGVLDFELLAASQL